MDKAQFLKDNKSVKLEFTEMHRLWSTWENEELKIVVNAPVTVRTDISRTSVMYLSDLLGYNYDPEDIELYVDDVELE